MKTFKRIILCSILIMAGLNSYAEHHGIQKDRNGWKQRVLSEKIAFITTELSLSPEEAKVFWPVYDRINEKKDKAFMEIGLSFKALDDATRDNPDGKDVKAAIDRYLKALEQNQAIDKEAAEQFSKILPVEKVGRLYVAEEKFRRNQIYRLQKRKEEQHHENGR